MQIVLTTTYEDHRAGRIRNDKLGDGRSFIDLLVPIGLIDDSNRGEGVVYACRALNQRTLRCTEYANRPPICSDYPYGRACEWCTVDPVNTEAPIAMRPFDELAQKFSPRYLETGFIDPGFLDVWFAVADRDARRRRRKRAA